MRHRSTVVRSMLAALGTLAFGVLAWGAPPSSPPAAPSASSPSPALKPITPAAHTDQQPAVIDQVLLVSTPSEYVRAIGTWTPTRRFPVFIDDGTHLCRENIARFVRAFKPARVVRPAEAPPAPGAGDIDMNNPDAVAGALAAAVRAAWGAPDERALHDLWRATPTLPAGIVVYDPRDPAWAGALALAAGHGQLLVRFDKPTTWGRVHETIPLAEAASLVTLTSDVFKAWLPDKTRAAAMRAVTLCLNAPVRVQLAGGESLPGAGPMVCKPGESVALCDLMGRFSKPGGGGAGASRWGVGAQLFGSASESSYRAMCALFLTADRAFVFDGYNAGPGFDDYDGTRAAKSLTTAGLAVELHDRPDNKPADWRAACARPLDDGLILVNSHGMRDVFNLADQPASCGDIPELLVPAAVSVVHSWSATSPGDRWTVAGRWFERGAYAYVGSVHEPYLSAFVPTPRVTEMLAKGVPLGLAVRMEAPPWRIAVLGDPLAVMVGKPAPRVPTDTTVQTDIATWMAERLKAKSFADGAQALVLLGRDKDAARLVSALLRDQPAQVTAPVAESTIGAAFRAGDLDTFFALLKVVAPTLDWKYEHPLVDVPDMAWHAAHQLGLKLSDERAALLAPLIRTGGGGETVRDAMELYRVIEARRGKDAARAFLQRVADETKAPGVKQVISERLRTL